MEISGTRTKVHKVTVSVDEIQILRELDEINRKHLGINPHCFLVQRDNKYVLMIEEYSYHGRSWSEVLDENPSEEVVEYLSSYKKFLEITKRVKNAKV